jgi:Protein of unknown function (DUF4038)/Putative collagen-binding domain of a collagenase
VGDPTLPLPVTVTNTGNGILSVSSVAVSGSNAADFSESDNCVGQVAVESICTINVTFNPSVNGQETAQISITDNAGNSPESLNLTGTGMISSGQLITLSPDRTHLINSQTNTPVFVVGDTAYNLSVQLTSDSDIDQYLAARASQGINLIWVAAIDIGNHGTSTSQQADGFGNDPWGGAAPFTNENPAYWGHVDYVVQQAESYGITVLFGTAFVNGYGGCGNQYCADIEAASGATMTAYGEFLGNRYKSYPNIVWLIGGDSDIGENGSGLQAKLNDLATGIAAVDPNHLFTVEETSTEQGTGIAAYTYWNSYPWFNLNTIYPKPGGNNPLTAIAEAISQGNASYQNGTPTFSIEDVYDFEGGITAEQLRTEGYTEVLSGAYLGRMFGSSAIWPFNASCCNNTDTTWQAQLTAATIQDQQRLGELFRSREHWLLVPDTNHTVVTAGYGTGNNVTVTSRTSDGQTIISYIPNGNATTLTVNLGQITSASSTVNCWWFSPSGASQPTSCGSFTNSGTQTFQAPDSNDWVLVLDDSSAQLPPPGNAP